jgi:hypothetical protein
MHRGIDMDHVTQSLPPLLRIDVLMFLHAPLVESVPWFRNVDRAAIRQVGYHNHYFYLRFFFFFFFFFVFFFRIANFYESAAGLNRLLV